MLGEMKIRYLGFGSPLIDVIGDVTDEMIKTYNLSLDSTIHAKIQGLEFFPEFLTQCNVFYVPGGCSYNAMRVFNWMLEKKDDEDYTALLGSVGNDIYGDIYQTLIEKENIVPIFETFDDVITGICLVFCNQRDRGHVTDLGASILISNEFVERIWNTIKNVELIYAELFILKHRKDIVHQLATLQLPDEKRFGFNLPSFYFIETYLEDITILIGYADIFFANAAEAMFYATLLGIQTDDGTYDIGFLCKELSRLPKKNKNKNRVCVITAGPRPAHVCEYNFVTDSIEFYGKYAPRFVEDDDIIDTNGAGDAFAGGFLSRYIRNQPLEECMKAGHWAASLIIQKRGCQIPVDIKYDSSIYNNDI